MLLGTSDYINKLMELLTYMFVPVLSYYFAWFIDSFLSELYNVLVSEIGMYAYISHFYYGLSHHCIQDLATFCPQSTELGKSILSPEGISAAATVFNVIMESELEGNSCFLHYFFHVNLFSELLLH